MALHSLYCADVPLRNWSLTHSLCVHFRSSSCHRNHNYLQCVVFTLRDLSNSWL